MAAGTTPAHSWAVGLSVTLAYAIWRLGTLQQLPVWDGAMSIVPAAVTLEDLGFDIMRLLALDDYDAGGPNTHALSTYTWFVAALIRLLGDYEAALPFLHLVSFAFVGLLAAGTHRAAIGGKLNNNHALLVTGLAVLYPPMVVQGSDVYLDLPVAAGATWAIALALQGKWRLALAAACLATSVKPTAVIAIPPLACVALLQQPRNWGKVLSLALPSAVGIMPLLASKGLRESTVEGPISVLEVTRVSLIYLGTMPLLFALLLVIAALFLLKFLSSRPLPEGEESRRLFLTAVSLAVSYLLFFFLNPLASRGIPSLPRYTTILVPILGAGFVSESVRRFGGAAGHVGGGLLLVLFVTNLNGRLEPSSRNLYALAERSLAYEQLLAVQESAFKRFEQLVGVMPTYYDHFTHYRLAFPQTGWASSPTDSGTPVWTTPDRHWRTMANLPDHFAMLIEAGWLGGQELTEIKRQAEESPEWSVQAEVFAQGEFINEVVIVTRNK